MKLKAQNTIEVISLVAVVVIVAGAIFMFAKNHNGEIANLSSINTIESNNVQSPSSPSGGNDLSSSMQKPGISAETAGSLSSIVANMNENALKKALKDKTAQDLYNVKSYDDKDIFDVANSLIDELGLKISPFDKSDLAVNTKDTLVEVAMEAKAKLNGAQSASYKMYTAMLAKIIE